MPSVARDPLGPPRVLIDTNGWFLPTRSGTRLAEEIERLVPGAELAVPASVLTELRRLQGRRVEDATVAYSLARAALCIPTRLAGDDAVLDLAVRSGSWVLTADRLLVRRLLARGVPVLVPRDRTRLQRVLPVGQSRVVPATVKKRARIGAAPPRRRRFG